MGEIQFPLSVLASFCSPLGLGRLKLGPLQPLPGSLRQSLLAGVDTHTDPPLSVILFGFLGDIFLFLCEMFWISLRQSLHAGVDTHTNIPELEVNISDVTHLHCKWILRLNVGFSDIAFPRGQDLCIIVAIKRLSVIGIHISEP